MCLCIYIYTLVRQTDRQKGREGWRKKKEREREREREMLLFNEPRVVLEIFYPSTESMIFTKQSQKYRPHILPPLRKICLQFFFCILQFFYLR